MPDLDAETLEKSFAEIAPRGVAFASAFYHRLFQAHPELFPLFAKTNMAAQLDKLVATLGLVVANLRRPDVLASEVRALGRRHGGYGVVPAQYPMVKAALLETLAEFHGDGWTETRRVAWGQAYDLIASLMIAEHGTRGHP